MSIFLGTKIPMFLDIPIVLGIAETVVMPLVLKLLIMLRPSLNLKLGRLFISNDWTPNSTNKLSMSIYRYIFKRIYYSLVVFTTVLFKFSLVSLNKFAFYVYLNL